MGDRRFDALARSLGRLAPAGRGAAPRAGGRHPPPRRPQYTAGTVRGRLPARDGASGDPLPRVAADRFARFVWSGGRRSVGPSSRLPVGRPRAEPGRNSDRGRRNSPQGTDPDPRCQPPLGGATRPSRRPGPGARLAPSSHALPAMLYPTKMVGYRSRRASPGSPSRPRPARRPARHPDKERRCPSTTTHGATNGWAASERWGSRKGSRSGLPTTPPTLPCRAS